jgi:hypothetical protein
LFQSVAVEMRNRAAFRRAAERGTAGLTSRPGRESGGESPHSQGKAPSLDWPESLIDAFPSTGGFCRGRKINYE